MGLFLAFRELAHYYMLTIYVTEHRKREHFGQFIIYHFVMQAIIVDNLKKRRKITHFFFFAPDETSILPLHVDQI